MSAARMMVEYMDTTTDPCEDFYTFACGGWASSHPIPPDKSVFDTFETLREMLDAALRVELESPHGPTGPTGVGPERGAPSSPPPEVPAPPTLPATPATRPSSPSEAPTDSLASSGRASRADRADSDGIVGG